MGLPVGKLLVTGAAGFIGSAVVWALNKRGITDIDLCDLASPEKQRNLAPLSYSAILSPEVLRKRALSGERCSYSHVFHLGACSSTTERDLAFLLDNNFGFTRDLARWSLAAGARFIYASSAATYGDGSHGMSDSEATLSQLQPLNSYGYSKHLFDLYAQSEGFLCQVVGLKYFNVFGPNEQHKGAMRSVVHKAHDEILATGKLSLFKSENPQYPDGKQQRDFLYVKDAAAMTLHLAFTDSAGGLYNLGSGVAHTWLELAEALFKAEKLQPRIDFIDLPQEIRAGYQYHTCADLSRLRATGYGAKITPLASAVNDCIRNYLLPDKRLGEE
ncbi:ADP-glyceromanno-heptose 6-epimerase [Nibricoccus sp. IMCC34717]|uniref:ADP-glyceromanno-heptose 6-epimerase n=1 Tax=Nibricoccus sp. IMCC34717 TaxID=3034021 RepID=UPI00384B020A